MKTLYFTVTNELSYDQRMIRICGTLSGAGYQVVLVGRKLKNSVPLIHMSFEQKRLYCFFTKGFGFYAEYNIRLFFWLLFRKMDLICAIDLDTILPCYIISRFKCIPRVYDAHELFCEMKEVVTRPSVYRIWKTIEKFSVPRFKLGYTVSKPISEIFNRNYGVHYALVRNMAKYTNPVSLSSQVPYIIYQGAVNEGRHFENLIPAMKSVSAPLHIYGDGNFLEQAKQLIKENGLEKKVLLKGKIKPAELPIITAGATIGISLFEKGSLSNYYSLANRFFDYLQAGVPQLCSDYPAYREINDLFQVALLIVDHSSLNIAQQLNNLLENEVLRSGMRENSLQAAKKLNWENEEIGLVSFYSKIWK